MTDSLLAAGIITLNILFALGADVQVDNGSGASERPFDALGWALIVATNLPIAIRRVMPLVALWAATVLTVTFWVLDYPDEPSGIALMITLFSVGAHVPRPRSLYHFLGAAGVASTVIVAGVFYSGEDLPWPAVPANLIIMATAWILGDNIRTRREYLIELEAKAARAEADRLNEAERATSRERTRIARELHDVVAHSMSVMVVQAGAARRVVTENPDRAVQAITTIEETGRESLAEMRRVLGVLRNEGVDAEAENGASTLMPAPTLDDLERLVLQVRDAGLPVELTVSGPVRKLAAGLELSAYRVVQESLTNALKHAGPATAAVDVQYSSDQLTVRVTDDGRGAAAHDKADRPLGHGLLGMRERVDAFGGELQTGARRGGGYEVVAAFPVATGSSA
ncbi:MAG: sensor histidine kinase [Actinomycetota bacterium]